VLGKASGSGTLMQSLPEKGKLKALEREETDTCEEFKGCCTRTEMLTIEGVLKVLYRWLVSLQQSLMFHDMFRDIFVHQNRTETGKGH
jgi:hypothetical protein